MKFATFSLAAFVTTVSADNYFNITSAPFRLFLKSDNTTINGTALGGCHQGAAIEGLCLTNQRPQDPATWYTTFTHNVSASAVSNATDTQGILAFTLPINGGQEVPSAMQLSINPTSNIAVPIIYPGYEQYSIVQFDESGSLYIAAYQNDFASPPESPSPPWKIYEWYVCLTRWSYLYETLAWKVGMDSHAPPQNPSCQKVEVFRIYI
ncbi:hypothetical protein IQ06DRAFT_304078 [Phaeosphaeriaceae sp. SRC1lsM3a]|nr:hypothetical protein IQ06DRAFT_304078 [Stagonospora sp. SRC1lsM3a]